MKRFIEDGKLMMGINYWASDHSIRMWDDFHPDVIEEDFRRLSEKGVTVQRVFPLWPIFQPLNATYNNDGIYDYRFGEDPLPDTAAGCAFRAESAGDYAAWYRVLRETARTERVLDAESPTVRLTEHPTGDGWRYAVAVNYSGEPAEVHLLLCEGWEVVRSWGGALSGEILRLGACDAAVFELCREQSCKT